MSLYLQKLTLIVECFKPKIIIQNLELLMVQSDIMTIMFCRMKVLQNYNKL